MWLIGLVLLDRFQIQANLTTGILHWIHFNLNEFCYGKECNVFYVFKNDWKKACWRVHWLYVSRWSSIQDAFSILGSEFFKSIVKNLYDYRIYFVFSSSLAANFAME